MAERQMQDLNRILKHLRENAPRQSDDDNKIIDAYEGIERKDKCSSGAILDDDHPYSVMWPEVFCNGQRIHSKQFYQNFPFLEGIDPFDEEAAGTSRLRTGPPDQSVEAPPALIFVDSLISLELDDLPDDEQGCPICKEQYRTGELAEMPLELPCGHVVGRDCLLTWLSTFASLDDCIRTNSCPTCRAQTPVEERRDISTPQGLAQLLRDANYLLTGSGPLILDRTARHHWEAIKKYANVYLEERKMYEYDRVLLEQKRIMGERKVDIFLVLLKRHIATYAQSISSLPSEKQEETAENLVETMRRFERRGMLEPYLDMMDGLDVGNGDLGASGKAMKVELAALPHPLAVLMGQTYSETWV